MDVQTFCNKGVVSDNSGDRGRKARAFPKRKIMILMTPCLFFHHFLSFFLNLLNFSSFSALSASLGVWEGGMGEGVTFKGDTAPTTALPAGSVLISINYIRNCCLFFYPNVNLKKKLEQYSLIKQFYYLL